MVSATSHGAKRVAASGVCRRWSFFIMLKSWPIHHLKRMSCGLVSLSLKPPPGNFYLYSYHVVFFVWCVSWWHWSACLATHTTSLIQRLRNRTDHPFLVQTEHDIHTTTMNVTSGAPGDEFTPTIMALHLTKYPVSLTRVKKQRDGWC